MGKSSEGAKEGGGREVGMGVLGREGGRDGAREERESVWWWQEVDTLIL